ncbi:MAG TPA: FeoC-like transcriptional regulator [Pontiella sp.]|nr:FeoC-like transcriptional regulator [Pontiella sp.]
MLSSIVNLLRERGGALSVQEISLALEIESGALHPMLEMLVRKEKIVRIDLPCKTGCAGGCTQSDTMIFYKAKV